MTISFHDRPMKDYHNRLLSLVSCILLSMTLYGASPGENGQLFYYSFDEKIGIVEVPGKFMVKKKPETKQKDVESMILSLVESAGFNWFNSDICTVETAYAAVEKVIEGLLEQDAILSARHVYVTSKDLEHYNKTHLTEPLNIGFVDKIAFKFNNNVDEPVQDSILKAFNMTVDIRNEVYEMAPVSKKQDVISTANRMYETGLFRFVCPEIICKLTLWDEVAFHPNDPYYMYQVTLHNTGQSFNGHTGTPDADIDAPEAWALTMGSEDIVIAVIDEGVSPNHTDLPNTRQVRLNGSNFGSGDPNDPSPTGNHNHGNACAGVIAATANNGEGIAGIAPLCKIMPIRVDDTTTPTQIANTFTFALGNGANIISNSWGYNSITDLYPIITASVEFVINNNVLVLFSAGNTANHTINDNGFVCFPANQKRNGMLAVGASDRYDYQADYSPTDTCIDIVAPSHRAYPYNSYNGTGISGENLEMWTIDIPDDYGYNPWPSDQVSYFSVGSYLPNLETGAEHYKNYTGRFGGTSHSCPVVAGVAALVLSMNPELTPQNVCNILKTTADKIGGYTYVNGKSPQTGYGRVNAKNAVWLLCDTTSYVNEDLYMDTEILTGCDIYMKDDFIYDAILRVRPKNSVTIDGEFYIENGILDIKRITDY